MIAIREQHAGRSPRAVSMDARQTARRSLDPNTDDLHPWQRAPNRYDVQGVDDERVVENIPEPKITKTAESGTTDHEKYSREYERLKSIPVPKGESIGDMIDRTDRINKLRRKINESDPKKIADDKKYAERYERRKSEPEPKKDRIDTNKMRVGMVIRHEDEQNRWRVVKVMRVNVQVVPVPTLPSDNPITEKKNKFKYYLEET